MNKIIWYFKQLLPLRYKSIYIENGLRTESTWKMWMGRCYNVQSKIINHDK